MDLDNSYIISKEKLLITDYRLPPCILVNGRPPMVISGLRDASNGGRSNQVISNQLF